MGVFVGDTPFCVDLRDHQNHKLHAHAGCDCDDLSSHHKRAHRRSNSINNQQFKPCVTDVVVVVVVVRQATVAVRDGVDIIQTNMSFLRQQFTRMAMHILRRNGKDPAA